MKTKIPIKRFVPAPLLAWGAQYARLLQHHEEETKFLIARIEELEKLVMPFLLVRVQKERGCDYTIGCGVRLTELKAADLVAALQESREIVIETRDSENPLIQAILVTAGTYLPVAQWYAEMDAAAAAEKMSAEEVAERAELARLQAKYGGAAPAPASAQSLEHCAGNCSRGGDGPPCGKLGCKG